MAAAIAGVAFGVHDESARQLAERDVLDFDGGGNAVGILFVILGAAVAELDSLYQPVRERIDGSPRRE